MFLQNNLIFVGKMTAYCIYSFWSVIHKTLTLLTTTAAHMINNNTLHASQFLQSAFDFCYVFMKCKLFLADLQICVKTVLLGFGNGWLKYCAMVQFWGGHWAAQHFESDSRNLAGMFYTSLHRVRTTYLQRSKYLGTPRAFFRTVVGQLSKRFVHFSDGEEQQTQLTVAFLLSGIPVNWGWN